MTHRVLISTTILEKCAKKSDAKRGLLEGKPFFAPDSEDDSPFIASRKKLTSDVSTGRFVCVGYSFDYQSRTPGLPTLWIVS